LPELRESGNENMKLKNYLRETELEVLQKKYHVPHYKAKRVYGWLKVTGKRREDYEAEFVKRLLGENNEMR